MDKKGLMRATSHSNPRYWDSICQYRRSHDQPTRFSVRGDQMFAGTRALRTISTIAGTDYYLTEVRNVFKTRQDVTALWGCRPEEIKMLGLDLGQACVVGASALLPEESKEAELEKAQRDQDGRYRSERTLNRPPVPPLIII
ncbi:hypothetical protein BC939DRAFT_505807 [Gamsiella multidivaricata]|uniref:uncharacterized protein n=1 Tax=Gamsiella multidivaricata TaxID=101098 RepID=UPI002220E13B|nr:uncharacterized protein BC939DRAFT_505807 [Gamsiella multidivaricata]KAI7819289.1 hypothetical protein BC939DRAFT_505807 [Gamsiella multidivaricata]